MSLSLTGLKTDNLEPIGPLSMTHGDSAVLAHAERVLGKYLERSLQLKCPSGVSYAEEALDGIRGLRAVCVAGLLKAA